VLAAYHAGMNITRQWLADPDYSDDGVTLKKIPYADTRYHVKKVMHIYEEYCDTYRNDTYRSDEQVSSVLQGIKFAEMASISS
jgi:soluble lytic murein transglycosylase